MLKLRARGFTLIEMAVVLIIIGLILATTLPLLTERIGVEQERKGRKSLNSLKQEIIGFVLTNRYLPTLTDVNAMANGEDNWGHLVGYWSDSDITGSTNNICDYGSSPPDNLRVDRVTDAPAASNTTTYSNVAFVIASRGPNQNMQVDDDTGTPRTITTYPAGFSAENPPGDYFDDDDHTGAGHLGADYDIGDGLREEDFDDIVEYVTFDFLYQKVAGLGDCDEGPLGSEVEDLSDDTAWNDTENASVTNYDGSSAVGKNSDGDVELQTPPSSGGSVSSYGCLWYTGTGTGGTTCGADTLGRDGVCPFNNGVRAYFEFNTKRGSDGGWTFAFIGVDTVDDINDLTDDTTDDLDKLCGGHCGYNGYARGRDSSPTTNQLEAPKFALDFDYYRSTGTAYVDDAMDDAGPGGNGGYSSNNDHGSVSWLFWADDGGTQTPSDADDDVAHNTVDAQATSLISPTTDNSAGNATPDYTNGDYFQPSGYSIADYTAGTANGDADKWLDDGDTHQVRIEVFKADTDGADSNVFEIHAWFDCTTANCRDLTADMYTYATDTHTLTQGTDYGFHITTRVTDFPQYADFANMRFGWTFGDCGGSDGHSTTISNFGLSWR